MAMRMLLWWTLGAQQPWKGGDKAKFGVAMWAAKGLVF
jgi:hypothetical protein